MEALKRAKRRVPRSGKGNPTADKGVYDAIFHALISGDLKAGTKLAEPRLAAIFGVSRERIRKVLHKLAAERALQIIPNRGVYVPKPTASDMRTVYEAHRVFEAGVLAELVRLKPPSLIPVLERHLADERAAALRGDRATSVRLSGAFHKHLVDALENPDLSRFLLELLSKSSVMVSVYEHASHSACAVDEHGAIVGALRAWDLTRALELSRAHFMHVEHRLHAQEGSTSAALALEGIFAKRALHKRMRT